MKTFDDLEFEDTFSIFGVGDRAFLKFDNGYGVSVLFGEGFYSNGEDTYELAVLKRDKDGNWDLHYDNVVADGDVVGYITEEEVTNLMKQVQEFKEEKQDD